MNMASVRMVFAFTIFLVSIGNAVAAFINVDCKTEKVGQYGQQTLLECVVRTPQNDAEIRVVTWKKDGVALLVFNKGKKTTQPGYSFAEPSWSVRNMNVSLLITNTAIEHQGDYKCMVITDIGDDSDQTYLKVTAKYNKPTIRLNPDGSLTCDAEGGYPQGELRWIDEHNASKDSQTEVKRTRSGLFHLTSNLTVVQGSKFTCRLFNASGGKEDEAVVHNQPKPNEIGSHKESDSTSKIVAPVVVIGSLIAGLLMALLFYRRRSQQARRHSTAPLVVGNHHSVHTYESDVEEGDHREMEKPCTDNHA